MLAALGLGLRPAGSLAWGEGFPSGGDGGPAAGAPCPGGDVCGASVKAAAGGCARGADDSAGVSDGPEPPLLAGATSAGSSSCAGAASSGASGGGAPATGVSGPSAGSCWADAASSAPAAWPSPGDSSCTSAQYGIGFLTVSV